MLLHNLRKYLVIAVFILLALPGIAQDTDSESEKVEMADAMRSNGKIYVVVAVVSIILTGLLVYTVTIDRKLNRLEKELEMDSRK